MTTLNRNYSIYSESYESSLNKYKSEGLVSCAHFKDRQMRENVVLAGF